MNDILNKTVFKSLLGFTSGMMVGLAFVMIEGQIPDSFMGIQGIMAFGLYLIFCSLLGAVGMGCQFIYEIERYSLTRATVTHFALTISCMLALGWGLGWQADDIAVWIIVVSWVAVYLIIWIVMYLTFRRKVRKMNENLRLWKSIHEENDIIGDNL